VVRNKRIWINNQENLPLDFAIMTGAVVVSFAKAGDEGDVLSVLFILYTALRYGWFVCYKCKVNQPPVRSVCFGLSKLTLLATVIVMLIIAFKDEDEEFDAA
jgi:uncharacterized MAPEG superfamily protein